MDPIFVGTCKYAIDSQRRVPLYKEWRVGDESPSFVLLPGRGGTIHAMPESLFREVIVSRAKQVSIANGNQADALALMGSRAHFTSVDKQGRIKLTPELMEHAGIEDQVVMVGGITTIQLMSPEKWAAKDQNMEAVLDTYDSVHHLGRIE